MKVFKRLIFIMLLVILLAILVFISFYAPIISGFGAKAVCSCVFVGDRSIESVEQNELGAFPLSMGFYSVDTLTKTATGSVWGLAKAKAYYRDGLGCTLNRKEEGVRNRLSELTVVKPILSDTIEWPVGRKVTKRADKAFNFERINDLLNQAFKEPDQDRPQKTRAVIIVHQGQIIAERYAAGFTPFTPQIGWSMSKSITNAMIGTLVQKKGFNIYAPAPVPEWNDKKDSRREITTDQLLRMSSGLQWEEDYGKPSEATKMLYRMNDMGAFAAEQVLEKSPDSEWYYSSGTTNLLSRLLKQQLGEEVYYQWPYETFFNPIGVTSAVFEMDGANTYVGSSYLWASARDWARMGLLYLNDGFWMGQRILPEGWVTYSSSPTPKAPLGEYGAQFWLNAGAPENSTNRRLPDCPSDMYFMDGYESQRVYIIPSEDLVIVRLGQTKHGNFDFNAFVSGIIAAKKDSVK